MKIAPNTNEHLAAVQTLKFVQSHAAAGAKVLDAGCGNGIIARLLIKAGYDLTAIDRHPEAVAEAKNNGITVEQADFLEYDSDTAFDLLLLSRALHHMQPLSKAVKQGRKLLNEGGLLLLEDFGAELMDRDSAAWFYGLKSVIKAGGVPLKGRGPKLEDDGSIPADPLESWRKHHFGKHGVAESTEMLAALETGFELVEQARLPYLYRYFTDDVSAEQLGAIFHWESLLCQIGSIKPIGLRVVAKRNRLVE